jgi:hypothetical protein
VLSGKVATFKFAAVWKFLAARGWKWGSPTSLALPSIASNSNVYMAPSVSTQTAEVNRTVFLDGNSLVAFLDSDDAAGRSLRSDFLRAAYSGAREKRRSRRESAAAKKGAPKAKRRRARGEPGGRRRISKEAKAAAEAASDLLLRKMLEEDEEPEDGGVGGKDRSMTAIDDGAETYFNGTAKRSKLV